MSIFRVVKDKNYTVINNSYLKDKNLSLRTIGLFTIVLSLSDNYKISMDSLLKLTKENYRSVKLSLKELKANGYVVINKLRKDDGTFCFEYIFFENNTINPLYKKCMVVNELQSIVNTNKKIESTTVTSPPVINYMDNINTKDNKINIDKQKLNSLTINLINSNFITLNDINLIKYDKFLKDLVDNHEFINVITAVNYSITKIMHKNYLDENDNPINNLYTYFIISVMNNLSRIESSDNTNLYE
jgi:hypothetical protein